MKRRRTRRIQIQRRARKRRTRAIKQVEALPPTKPSPGRAENSTRKLLKKLRLKLAFRDLSPFSLPPSYSWYCVLFPSLSCCHSMLTVEYLADAIFFFPFLTDFCLSGF